MKRLLYRANFNLRKYAPYTGKFPVHVDIELAGKCQLACTMCPYGDDSFNDAMQGMMPFDMAMGAIYEASTQGAKSIKFNFRGEPGLAKNLERCIASAKGLGIVETMINTNLTAFTHKRLKILSESGLDLMIISIDGATKTIYEDIRRKGNWEKLLDNLEYLYKLKSKIRIRIQMVEQPKNAHQVNFFKEKFSKYTKEIVIQKIRQSNEGERRRCPQPWQRLIVAWNGDVFACCSNWNNEAPVGKFPEQTLEQIWNKSILLDVLRENAKNFEGFPCRTCTVGDSYK